MSPGVTPNMSPSCQRPGNFPSPDPPSQTPGGGSEQQPILSPHPLHHGQTFFPNCGMAKNSQTRNLSPPPTTPTSKSCSNASILERALGTAIKQEHHVVTSAVMSAGPGQVSSLIFFCVHLQNLLQSLLKHNMHVTFCCELFIKRKKRKTKIYLKYVKVILLRWFCGNIIANDDNFWNIKTFICLLGWIWRELKPN